MKSKVGKQCWTGSEGEGNGSREAGSVGTFRGCPEQGAGGGGDSRLEHNATDAQRESINLRSTPPGGGTEETVPRLQSSGS